MISNTSTELAKLIGDNARSQGLAGNSCTHTLNSTLTTSSTIANTSMSAATIVSTGSGVASPVTTPTPSTTNTPVVDHLGVAWAVLQDVKLIIKPVKKNNFTTDTSLVPSILVYILIFVLLLNSNISPILLCPTTPYPTTFTLSFFVRTNSHLI